jgi:hypothetical protein
MQDLKDIMNNVFTQKEVFPKNLSEVKNIFIPLQNVFLAAQNSFRNYRMAL